MVYWIRKMRACTFVTADEEVVSEKKKPLTKDERLALIKKSAEKKSDDDID